MPAHDKFKIAMANYYKAERDRAERCLGDILTILTDDAINKDDVLLDRLTQHYQRNDA